MVERSFRLHLVSVGEQEINGLQCGPRCLWIEGPDNHGVDDVEDCEDDVGLISNVLEGWWGDLNHNEVAKEVCGGGQCSTFCADLQW